MGTITATELARRLSDVLNRVKYRRERFVVERGGEPVAVIEPMTPAGGVTLREFVRVVRGAPRPDEAFVEDLRRIRSEQPPAQAEFAEWPS